MHQITSMPRDAAVLWTLLLEQEATWGPSRFTLLGYPGGNRSERPALWLKVHSKVSCGYGKNLGPTRPGPGGPGPRPPPIIASEKAWVPGELRQAAACQAPVSAPSPLIGHLARAKSQLGVSPVGDLTNESCKAGRGWGCCGCQGVQMAHYHHKKHVLITRIIKRAWRAGPNNRPHLVS